MLQYYNAGYLELAVKKGKSMIYASLLKSGYSSFSLEILEYCDASQLIVKEQYYFDVLRPDYNILQTAGSSYGYQHTEETKEKIAAS